MKPTLNNNVRHLVTVFIVANYFTFASAQTIPQHNTENFFVPGEIIVKFTQPVDFTRQAENIPLRTGLDAIDQVDRSIRIKEARSLFSNSVRQSLSKTIALPSGEIVSVPSLSHIYRLRYPPEVDILSLIDELKKDPNIIFAEPNYIAHASESPNDSLYTYQWGLQNIYADSAWTVETGDSSVIIGILDTGVELFHEDLQNNIWINQDEIPANEIDDDGNGYVDDVYGWNFVADSNDPSDNAGHGTHVAGISAAATNNSIGIAGVSWHSKLIPVKVLNINGEGNYSDIAEGILYAAENGAKVISMSLGGYYPSELLETALLNAYSTSVLVGSAGNDSRSDPYYPAAYSFVMGVAGVDSNEVRWADSNYGSWVSISAPAVGIYSTRLNHTYGSLSGTSMAASFVSGTAALLLSQDPTLDAASVFNQVLNSSDNIDMYNPGYEGSLGVGRVNAYRAVYTTPSPILEVAQINVDDTAGGDGDGVLDADETADFVVTLYNAGKTVTDINATLFTSDTLVQITSASSAYEIIEARNTAVNQTPFTVAVNPDAQDDHIVTFQLALASTSGADTLTFTLQTQMEFNLSGFISSDMTLTADILYVVTGSILVDQNVTLTLEPGVELRFDSGTFLQVKGTLIARGNPENRITFTSNQVSPSPGDWGSIEFFDQCSDANFDTTSIDSIVGEYISGCILEFANIEYAGGNNSLAAIVVTNSAVFINHVNIINSSASGISLRKSTGGNVPMTKITDSEITHNFGDGVRCDCYQYNVSIMIDSCLISNNESGGINTSGGDHGGAHYFIFTNNTIAENNGTGIWGGSNGIQFISGNTIINNVGEGITTRGHGPYTISDNFIGYNTGRGIHGIYTTHYITGNIIASNGGGIAISQGGNYTITGNYIVGNKAVNGAAFDPSGAWSSPVTLEGNTIVGNVCTMAATDTTVSGDSTTTDSAGSAAILTFQPEQGDPNFILNNNNIFGNIADYAIANTRDIALANINAENNWWGTSDVSNIRALVYDWNDDGSLGIVDVDPFLSSPNPTAPAHLYSLTTNPPSPVGIELVEVYLGFTAPMDTTYNPMISLNDTRGNTYYIDQSKVWLDGSYFRATININEMFFDDLYTIKVSGAIDTYGFDMHPDTTWELIVYTAGSAARELHVTSLDDEAYLAWNPSSIPNLLGYNLYRSMTSGGSYQRLNQAIITDITFVDSVFEETGAYYYVYTIMDANFRESGYSNEVSVSITMVEVAESKEIPTVFSLSHNYPNPFNPNTTLRFGLPEAARTRLVVYDLLGREVIRLVDEHLEPGYHAVVWHGKTATGIDVPSGIYIARIVTPEYTKSIKMLLLK